MWEMEMENVRGRNGISPKSITFSPSFDSPSTPQRVLTYISLQKIFIGTPIQFSSRIFGAIVNWPIRLQTIRDMCG